MRWWIPIAFLLMMTSCDSDSSIEMVKVPKGKFVFGDNNGQENEKPEVPIKMKSFLVSKNEITVAQFSEFIQESGLVTESEKNGGMVFKNENWTINKDYNWKTPYGKKTDFNQIQSEPVRFVTYEEAQKFCKWAGGRLPSEIEMEYLMNFKGGKMNIWTGDFPKKDDGFDGFSNVAPVGSFESNELGLNDVKGNVWEWCQDNYHFEVHDKLSFKKKITQKPYLDQAYDLDNNVENAKVIKGGSYLCNKCYCAGYRKEARQKADKNQGYCHIGFRLVKDEK